MNLIRSFNRANMLFVCLLLLCVLYALVVRGLGLQQDQEFKQNYSLYQSAATMLNQGNYTGAEPMFLQLLSQQPNSFILEWSYGLTLAGSGRNGEAAAYFAKARAQRPFLVNNPSFLLQYGQVLYNLRQYREAQKYLTRYKQFAGDSNSTKLADPLLKDIQAKLQTK